jgi:hypothetical protein
MLSRIKKRLLLFFLVLLALVFVVFIVFRVNLYFQVKSKLRAVLSAGLPTSGAELNKWLAAVEMGRNGALVLTGAFGLFAASPGTLANVNVRARLLRTNVWAAEVREEIREQLQTNAPALAMIDEGLKFERFRFPVDYSEGFAARLPHLRLVKEAAVLLSLRTALAAEEGRTNEWPNFLARQIRLAEALNEEPTVIGVMVRIACLRMAVNAAERSLRHSTPEMGACQRLCGSFLGAETNLLPSAFISERAIATPVFRMSPEQWREMAQQNDEEDPDEKAPPTRSTAGAGDFWRLLGFFERDLNFYLGTMASAIALTQQPPPANLAVTNLFETSHRISRKRFYILSGMLLPALGSAAVKDVASRAYLRMAAMAFAVEAFRISRGRLPANLEEVVPGFIGGIPLDPFTGKALRYVALEAGYRIYSVGPDGADDGGVPEPQDRIRAKRQRHDLTFTVEH